MQKLRAATAQTYPQRLLVALVGVSGLFACMAICSLSPGAAVALSSVALLATVIVALGGWSARLLVRGDRAA